MTPALININWTIGALAESIRKLLNDRKFTDEEKAGIELELSKAQLSLEEKRLEVERALLDADARIAGAQSAVLSSEAKGESWLQRNWRPLMMLIFALLLVCTWFGLFSQRIGPELQMELLTVVKWGMSGYIVGRSAEKIAGRAAGK